MIRKLIYITVLFWVCVQTISGQENPAYKTKWQTTFLFGGNIPITSLLQGSEFDYSHLYDDNSYYWQLMSISYFFHKHWGMELNFQAATSNRIRNREREFDAYAQSKYKDNYYVKSIGVYDGDFTFFAGDFQRAYLSVIYRIEKNKFYVHPKMAMGITTISTDGISIKLKEKGSNYEYKVSCSEKENGYTFFTVAPSASFGYKLFKRFYLNAGIALSYYKANMAFEKEFTNLYTEENAIEYFNYRKNIFTLSMDVGVIYRIW